MAVSAGWRRPVHAALVCLIGWTLVLAQPARAAIQYFYDETGRLIGVLDPSALQPNVAVYHYDAVGNVIAITRQPSSQTAILGFAPACGPQGTAVTVWGTGFSTVPSQNAVTFNGVAASVSSATATELLTSVPAGATTGLVAVTAPGGTATSAVPFAVGSCDAPTITGFTPTVGVAGTAVTITGTNFDPVPLNDRVSGNVRLWPITSATATSIVALVPSLATSGRITVTTSAGTAVSTSDFFVPPSPYGPLDVQVTDRMAIGDSKAVAVTTAGRIGLVLFDGVAGQRISLRTVSTANIFWGFTIFRPDGPSLATLTAGNGGYLDTQTLPVTGTYTLMVDPQGTGTGQVTLTLYDVPPDLTGTITVGGPAVTVAFGTPGQNARLTFDGTAGQRVSTLGSSTSNINWRLTILAPDGTQLATTFGGNAPFIDTQTLAVTGTYTLLVDPDQFGTGQIALTLYTVTDFAGSIPAIPGFLTVPIGTPGQNGAVTFAGSAGQSVTVQITNNTIAGVTVSLRRADGTTLTSKSWSGSTFSLTPQTLPATETYTVFVDPSGRLTGSLKVNLTSP